MNWYIEVLKNYAVFSGRASRKEYWMFMLINFFIAISLAVIDAMLGTYGAIYVLYTLAVFIPGLAVLVRRLHDTGRSGWWFWLSVIPIIGAIVLLVFLIIPSQPGENQYGPVPE